MALCNLGQAKAKQDLISVTITLLVPSLYLSLIVPLYDDKDWYVLIVFSPENSKMYPHCLWLFAPKT